MIVVSCCCVVVIVTVAVTVLCNFPQFVLSCFYQFIYLQLIHSHNLTTSLPSGKASASRAEDPGFESRGRVIPVTRKLALQWLPCHLPGVIRVSAGTGWPGVSIL